MTNTAATVDFSYYTELARNQLDYWEHYHDHAGFIAEQGGQEAYDAEYSIRARNFFTMNMRSYTDKQRHAVIPAIRARD